MKSKKKELKINLSVPLIIAQIIMALLQGTGVISLPIGILLLPSEILAGTYVLGATTALLVISVITKSEESFYKVRERVRDEFGNPVVDKQLVKENEYSGETISLESPISDEALESVYVSLVEELEENKPKVKTIGKMTK